MDRFSFSDEDLEDDVDFEDMDEDGLSNEDLGLCPHGSTDDEGCDEPGCYGGPEGMDDADEEDDDY